VTSPHRKPEPRGPRPAASFVPHPQPSEENLLELREPYDVGGPEYPEHWLPGLPGRPASVIVIAQLPGLRPEQSCLAELLGSGPTRSHEPEPDLEAEP
jgi:hypothetical protein